MTLAGMIMDAQAAGAALLEADWAEVRFRVAAICDVAQHEGMADIPADRLALVHAIGQVRKVRPGRAG